MDIKRGWTTQYEADFAECSEPGQGMPGWIAESSVDGPSKLECRRSIGLETAPRGSSGDLRNAEKSGNLGHAEGPNLPI